MNSYQYTDTLGNKQEIRIVVSLQTFEYFLQNTLCLVVSTAIKELCMSVNIQDVAKAAKVSVSTVSRSFTRPELVSEATRSRVLRIADEMSFSISRSATALKSGKALRVALLMSDHIRLWFSASVIEGLNQVCTQTAMIYRSSRSPVSKNAVSSLICCRFVAMPTR